MALSFGQVTDVLMLANHIPEERRSTFVARLKQWQKMGFPEGVNVGRGVRVGYGATQLYQLALHMRLLALGLTPERAQRVIKHGWTRFRSGIADVTRRMAERQFEYLYFIVQYHALSDLQDGADHDHIYVLPALDWMIADALGEAVDVDEDDREFLENFALIFRNLSVNALLLEVNSILIRIWVSMEKLGIEPKSLEGEVATWVAEMLEEKTVRAQPPTFLPDRLKGVEICLHCFAREMLRLEPQLHGERNGSTS